MCRPGRDPGLLSSGLGSPRPLLAQMLLGSTCWFYRAEGQTFNWKSILVSPSPPYTITQEKKKERKKKPVLKWLLL